MMSVGTTRKVTHFPLHRCPHHMSEGYPESVFGNISPPSKLKHLPASHKAQDSRRSVSWYRQRELGVDYGSFLAPGYTYCVL